MLLRLAEALESIANRRRLLYVRVNASGRPPGNAEGTQAPAMILRKVTSMLSPMRSRYWPSEYLDMPCSYLPAS